MKRQIERLVTLVNPAGGCFWLFFVPLIVWIAVYVLGPAIGIARETLAGLSTVAAACAFVVVFFRLAAKRKRVVALCLAIEGRVRQEAERLQAKR